MVKATCNKMFLGKRLNLNMKQKNGADAPHYLKEYSSVSLPSKKLI